MTTGTEKPIAPSSLRGCIARSGSSSGPPGPSGGEPSGEDLQVNETNADGSKTAQNSKGFLLSGDKNFRPSDIVFEKDGAVHVADWQNVIIGHMQHNVRNPNRDHPYGRIYRITAENRPLQKDVAIEGAPIAALLENLKHPVDSVRHRTRAELSERNSAEVAKALEKWVAQFDPKKAEGAHGLLEALWFSQQDHLKHMKLLGQLLQSPEPHARNAALTVQHLWTANLKADAPVAAEEKSAPAKPSGVIVVRVGTVVEKMLYDTKEFTVRVGKKIKLTFANPDFMPHNFVIVKPGKADEIALKAAAMGAQGFETGFVPDSPEVLFATKLVDNGKEQVLEFEVPKEPGGYPFVCTFPGHHILMRGVMKVAQ